MKLVILQLKLLYKLISNANAVPCKR